MKEKLCISFSGGRTSAYMTKLILDNWSDRYEIVVLFANTSLEHDKTLEFVNNCDKHLGFNSIWLEAVTHLNERTACTYNIVTFETALRNGELFEDAIEKYGIPNKTSPHCTRSLKLDPIRSYLRERDRIFDKCKMAIGIRLDEERRVSKQAERYNIIYPLIHDFPTSKRQVLEFWHNQKFNLEIDEFEGNCKGCFKKSHKKQFMQIDRDPSVYDFWRRMERDHQDKGARPGEWTKIFREELSVDELFQLHSEIAQHTQYDLFLDYGSDEESNTCSESCEVFDMEVYDKDDYPLLHTLEKRERESHHTNYRPLFDPNCWDDYED